MITRLRAAFVIGHRDGDHVVYRDGAVVWEDDHVIFVGRGHDGPVDRDLDAGLALVSPGFIDLDALADIDHALIDCWHGAETAPGLQWSEDYFRHRRHDVFSFEDTLFKREFALVQLIRNGITTAMPIAAETHNAWAESYDEMAATAGIAARLGLRVYLGPSYRSGVNVTLADGSRDVLLDEPLGEAGLDEAIRFAGDFDGVHGGLVRTCLLPCRIETLTPALMRRTAAAARELGCLVRLHALQGRTELSLLERHRGRAPLDLLAETGLLGPNLLIPHAIFIGGADRSGPRYEAELARLAESGATVVHCPLTSLRYGMALESFDRYRQADVPIALGTDSFPPDMIRNMDIGSSLCRFLDGRLDAGSAADYFRAATLGGAKALGRDDLGRLAPGAKADLIVVDFSGPRVGPVDDPVRTLLMNCTGADITTVVIDGRVVMQDRRIPAVDEAAMRARAQAWLERMKAAYGERDFRRRPLDELFPPAFPEA